MSMNRVIDELRGGGRQKEEKAAKYFIQMRQDGTVGASEKECVEERQANSGTYTIISQLHDTSARKKVAEGLNQLTKGEKIILNKEDVKILLKMGAADVPIEGWGDVEIYSLHFSNLLRAHRFQEVVDRCVLILCVHLISRIALLSWNTFHGFMFHLFISTPPSGADE